MLYIIEKEIRQTLLYDIPTFKGISWNLTCAIKKNNKIYSKKEVFRKENSLNFDLYFTNIEKIRDELRENLKLDIVNLTCVDSYKWICHDEKYEKNKFDLENIYSYTKILGMQCYNENHTIRFEDKIVLNDINYKEEDIVNNITHDWRFLKNCKDIVYERHRISEENYSVLIMPYVVDKFEGITYKSKFSKELLPLIKEKSINIEKGRDVFQVLAPEGENYMEQYEGFILFYIENEQTIDVRTGIGQIGMFLAFLDSGKVLSVKYQNMKINLKEFWLSNISKIYINDRIWMKCTIQELYGKEISYRPRDLKSC